MRQQRQHEPIQRRIARFIRAGIDAGEVLAARQALFAVAEGADVGLGGAVSTAVVVTVALGMGVGKGMGVAVGVVVVVAVVVHIHAIGPDVRGVALVIVAPGGMWSLQVRAWDWVDAVHAGIAVIRRMRQVRI